MSETTMPGAGGAPARKPSAVTEVQSVHRSEYGTIVVILYDPLDPNPMTSHLLSEEGAEKLANALLRQLKPKAESAPIAEAKSVASDRTVNVAHVPEPASAATGQTALDVQVGGGHYKGMVIQPVEFCHKNGLGTCESNAIKYICRHYSKNGAEDLRKAIHYIELLLQLQYGEARTQTQERAA